MNKPPHQYHGTPSNHSFSQPHGVNETQASIQFSFLPSLGHALQHYMNHCIPPSRIMNHHHQLYLHSDHRAADVDLQDAFGHREHDNCSKNHHFSAAGTAVCGGGRASGGGSITGFVTVGADRRSTHSGSTANTSRSNQKRMKRPPVFPLQLYDVLTKADEDPSLKSIVSWLPDGRSFRVHNEKRMDGVLQQYFKGIKISSFTRQLQIYGFARYKGVCTHVLLQRGERHLLRNKSLDDFQTLSLNKKSERGGGAVDRKCSSSRSISDHSTSPIAVRQSSSTVIIDASSSSSSPVYHGAFPVTDALSSTPVRAMILSNHRQLQHPPLTGLGLPPATISSSIDNNNKSEDLSWLSDMIDNEPLPIHLPEQTPLSSQNGQYGIGGNAVNIIDNDSVSTHHSSSSGRSWSAPSSQQDQSASFDALIESMGLDAQFGDVFVLPTFSL